MPGFCGRDNGHEARTDPNIRSSSCTTDEQVRMQSCAHCAALAALVNHFLNYSLKAEHGHAKTRTKGAHDDSYV
jgi:hypothetical protein